MATERKVARRPGKSDVIAAIAVARAGAQGRELREASVLVRSGMSWT
jgi:hypothetical protein